MTGQQKGDLLMWVTAIKLKPELARAFMTMSDVNNQWHSNFQQQII
jgi:hypothetical protein